MKRRDSLIEESKSTVLWKDGYEIRIQLNCWTTWYCNGIKINDDKEELSADINRIIDF